MEKARSKTMEYLWILQNWDIILGAATGIITSASIIAKLTPTEVDNKILLILLKFIDKLAINNKPTEKKE